jgi:N-sulfoglucosamine sulfohydrolase
MGDTRPNIVYFVCHDLGKHLGCYDAMVASPNLDAFAAGGVRFANAFCSSPACSPSRACAMTGKYAHVSGAMGLAHMGWSLAPEQKSVVDYLNESGYETVHTGHMHERHPGMNRYQLDLVEHWRDWDTAAAVDRAIAYLEDRPASGAPFYLNVGTMEVHASVWDKKLDVYGGPVPDDEVYVPHYLPDSPALRAKLARFQAAIRYMDTHFQRLVDAVDRLGLRDDTFVVFTTDHGISAPRAKGTLYDRGVEISLMVRLPGGERAGGVCHELIPNIDVAPTVLEIAGIETPADMNGRSFLPWLRGEPYEPHEMIFTERNFHGEHPYRGAEEFIDLYDPTRAVRTRAFHYIRWFDPGLKKRPWLYHEVAPGDDRGDWDSFGPEPTEPRNEEELYHVPHDPGEVRDVAWRPEYGAVKRRLAEALATWMRDTDDPVLRGEVPERPEEPGWGPWEGLT